MEATGEWPGQWLINERLEAAKEILAETNQPMEKIAEAVGFGSSHALRHHFRRLVRLSPSDYRRQFSKVPMGKVASDASTQKTAKDRTA